MNEQPIDPSPLILAFASLLIGGLIMALLYVQSQNFFLSFAIGIAFFFGFAVWLWRRPATSSFRRLLAQSGVLMSQERWPEAIEVLERALHEDTHSFAAWFSLGEARLRLGRFSEAAEAFHQAVQISDTQAAAWREYAFALDHMQHHHEQALTAWDRALSLVPGDTAALIGKGEVLTYLRRYPEAAACFDEVLAAEPNNEEALRLRATLERQEAGLGAGLQETAEASHPVGEPQEQR